MIRRIGLAQAGQFTLILGSIGALLLALSVLAIVLQAQRDETRSADWMIAVAGAEPDQALIDHLLAQQRRNFSAQIVIVGVMPERLAQRLQSAGVAAADLTVSEPAPLTEQLRLAAAAEAPATVLIVAAPEDLLLTNKISRDLGLDAGTSAPPRVRLRIGPTLSAALAYWQYTLFGKA